MLQLRGRQLAVPLRIRRDQTNAVMVRAVMQEDDAEFVAFGNLEAHHLGPEFDRALDIGDLVNEVPDLLHLDRRFALIALLRAQPATLVAVHLALLQSYSAAVAAWAITIGAAPPMRSANFGNSASTFVPSASRCAGVSRS